MKLEILQQFVPIFLGTGFFKKQFFRYFLHCSYHIWMFSLCLHSSDPKNLLFYFKIDYDNLLQYSCLENPMGGGAQQAAVYGIARVRTQLSDSTFTFHFHALEKEMATHSSVLAWRSPGMGEPGGLPSMGSHRVGHD